MRRGSVVGLAGDEARERVRPRLEVVEYGMPGCLGCAQRRDLLAQGVAGPRQPGRDRGRGDAEHIGDLAAAQALHVVQPEQQLGVVGQPLERA